MPSDILSSSRGFGDNITESQHMLVAEIMVSGMNNESSSTALVPTISILPIKILNYLSNLMLAKSTQK